MCRRICRTLRSQSLRKSPVAFNMRFSCFLHTTFVQCSPGSNMYKSCPQDKGLRCVFTFGSEQSSHRDKFLAPKYVRSNETCRSIILGLSNMRKARVVNGSNAARYSAESFWRQKENFFMSWTLKTRTCCCRNVFGAEICT